MSKPASFLLLQSCCFLSFSFGSKEKRKGGAGLFFTMTCHCLRILKRKGRFCFCYWSHWERILLGPQIWSYSKVNLAWDLVRWLELFGWTENMELWFVNGLFSPLCLRSEDDCERQTSHTISINLWRVFWNTILYMEKTKRTVIRTTN